MPTVIDSLVVTLGLDPSNFTKGGKEAADKTDALKKAVVQSQAEMAKSLGLTAEEFRKWTAEANKADAAERRAATNIRGELKKTAEESARTGKEMQSGGQQAASFFSSIKNEALALLGVLLGGAGLAAVIKDSAKSMADLGREAKNIGIPVPDLDAFGMAVARSGGNADAARQSLRNLTDEMERFKVFGQSPLIQFLNPIGAQRGDTAIEVFKKFAAFAASHKNDVPLINLIGKGLGFDQGTINEAMRGREQVERDLAESKKIGTVTKEMADRAAELQADWEGLAQRIKHTTDLFVDNIEPALDGFIKWLDAKLDAAKDVPKPKVSDYTNPKPGEFKSPSDVTAPFVDWMLEKFGVKPSPPGADGGGWWSRHAPAWLGGKPSTSESAITPPQPPSSAAATMQQSHDFFRSKGLTEEQTAGVLANISAESGFNPNVSVNDGGKEAFGLFQHRDTRLAALRARYGAHPTAQQQLEFAWEELNGPERATLNKLRAVNTAGQAGAVFTGFERPANGAGEAFRRGQAADQFVQRDVAPSQQPAPGPRVASTPAAADQPLRVADNRATGFVPPPLPRPEAATTADNSTTNTTHVEIGTIIINGAKDAPAVAKNIRRAVNDSMVTQANRGLQ